MGASPALILPVQQLEEVVLRLRILAETMALAGETGCKGCGLIVGRVMRCTNTLFDVSGWGVR